MFPFGLQVPEDYARELLACLPPGTLLIGGYLYLHWAQVGPIFQNQLDAVSRIMLIVLSVTAAGYILRVFFGSLPTIFLALVGVAIGVVIRDKLQPSSLSPLVGMVASSYIKRRFPAVDILSQPDADLGVRRLLNAYFYRMPDEVWTGFATFFAVCGAIVLLSLDCDGAIKRWMYIVPVAICAVLTVCAGFVNGLYEDQAIAVKILLQDDKKPK
jgi:hypothetical protein